MSDPTKQAIWTVARHVWPLGVALVLMFVGAYRAGAGIGDTSTNVLLMVAPMAYMMGWTSGFEKGKTLPWF